MKYIRNLIVNNIDIAFIEAHALFGTKSGDITPEQSEALENIIDNLEDLMERQIKQNL